MPFVFMKAALEGLILIEPHCQWDERGYFLKEFEKSEFKKHGIDVEFIEIFESMSKKGTLRGLHFQTKFPQGKLVRVTRGAAFDVAVDLRLDSDTLGRWAGFHLNAHEQNMLYIPEGFAHGFLALEEDTIMTYKCTKRYSKPHDSGIIWNDEDLAIEWPLNSIEGDPILSQRDQNHQSFRSYLANLSRK